MYILIVIFHWVARLYDYSSDGCGCSEDYLALCLELNESEMKALAQWTRAYPDSIPYAIIVLVGTLIVLFCGWALLIPLIGGVFKF